MPSFDDLTFEAEAKLVEGALADGKDRDRLRARAHELTTAIARLYRDYDVPLPPRIVETCMRQFEPLLRRYGDSRRRSPRRFSFVFAWWTTRRMEQALRQERGA